MNSAPRPQIGLKQQVTTMLLGIGLKAWLERRMSPPREPGLRQHASPARPVARRPRFQKQTGVRVGIAAGVAAATLVVLATRRRAPIHMSGSVEIAASLKQVYDVWCEYENFPRFMSLVDDVHRTGPNRSHWKVKGPADVPIEWNSVITVREPGRLLAWRSEPGSAVQHSGRVELEPIALGTRATVSMSYRPPGNLLGHLVASLFGRNPRQDLGRDLACMKAFIEGRYGQVPTAAREASRPAEATS
ncbi:SRPBCC family protein [Piscinibacter sp. HJYY11]|uniref:SRPBCC family protein n=1 Tax=Piscinibacter sp. HJYY11 TaxID=2801333 RepID=UPI00191F9987|nr:SRPBCC family protein [Piscinibacter sp. HJYY11]MBL0727207.1 SRPBCC family protein [Piscinibacter sp. HJYY11]